VEQVEEQRILGQAGAAQAQASGPAVITVQWPPNVSLGLNLTQCGIGRDHDRSALVESVSPQSPLVGKVEAGHALTAVNDQNVEVGNCYCSKATACF
jgi:hypothetical protein